MYHDHFAGPSLFPPVIKVSFAIADHDGRDQMKKGRIKRRPWLSDLSGAYDDLTEDHYLNLFNGEVGREKNFKAKITR